VTVGIGVVLYGNHLPRHPLGLLLVVALGAMTFCALGIAVTALIPNADAAPAIVNLLVLPLVFLSGTFFPVTNETINRISNIFPVRPFQQAIFTAIDPRHVTFGPPGHDLLVLVAWAVGGALVATRTFRWERRGP
jgi:ABC-2 type transport system permease protein